MISENNAFAIFEDDGEDESDSFGPLSPSEFDQVVTYAFDWTTESMLQQLAAKTVDIDVRFQRRDAWNVEQKSRYVQSVLLGIPVPQIVLAEHRDGTRRRYLVIDGRQRLLTLMQFVGQATASIHNGFRLRLPDEQTERWHGLGYSELPQDLATRFLTTPIRTTVLRGWSSHRILKFLFQRLNTQTVPLNAQELRLAVFGGPFVHFVDDAAVRSRGVVALLRLKPGQPDPRMQDVELLLRHFAYRNCMARYRGPIAEFLDETCKILNEEWRLRESTLYAQLEIFERAVAVCGELLAGMIGRLDAAGDTGDERQHRRSNRALMDAQLWVVATSLDSGSQPDLDRLRKVLIGCLTDTEFLAAVAATPRHKVQGRERFVILARMLGLPDFAAVGGT